MKKNKITAKELAIATGIAQSSFTDWKNGRSKPGSEAIKLISEYFCVTSDYLLGITNKPDRIIPKELEEYDNKWISVVREARASGLTPEQMQEFIKTLNKFKRH
jgi:transcriptional regulator with XRE-family HTH domain